MELQNKFVLRNACKDDIDTIYKLYESVKGTDFCVWDESYPGMQEILHDFETDNLYVGEIDGIVCGACSVMPENELDKLALWGKCNGKVNEICRIAVGLKYRGRGLAGKMAKALIDILKQRGCRYVRISAYEKNIPALKTYCALGFDNLGKLKLYDDRMYCLFQKKIQ